VASGKVVRPFACGPDGWRCGAMPAPRPLYRLGDVLRADQNEMIWIAEGEKATDALARMGLVAVTTAGGASAPHLSNWSALHGRTVTIMPDHDPAGWQYARAVVALCPAVGVRELRILDLVQFAPQLPAGGDAADLLDAEDWFGLGLGDAASERDCGVFLRKLADRIPPEPQQSTGNEQPATQPTGVASAADDLHSWVRHAWNVALMKGKRYGR
jgi:hypothetical protein